MAPPQHGSRNADSKYNGAATRVAYAAHPQPYTVPEIAMQLPRPASGRAWRYRAEEQFRSSTPPAGMLFIGSRQPRQHVLSVVYPTEGSTRVTGPFRAAMSYDQ